MSSETLSSDIETNEQRITEQFKNCSDFVVRRIQTPDGIKLLLIYIDGLCDTQTLDEIILKPLMLDGFPANERDIFGDVLQQRMAAITSVQSVTSIGQLSDGVLKANVGVLTDGECRAWLAPLKGFKERSVEEPNTEKVIRGPRDGFTESLRTNTSLLRRKIRSTQLKIESFSIGRLSKTDVAVAYIEGVVKESVLSEVRSRIGKMEIDGVLDTAFIEEFIEDRPYSPFPQIQNTERPDVVAANLLEGKVAIIADNTPFALILPMTFWNGLHAAEDHYERFVFSSFLRFVRIILFLTSLFLPSLYVALTTYHPKLLPTELLVSIAAAREGIPFPAIIEALLMEFVFEGLREAGLRLPGMVGQAVGIVGALVIGQSAVQAGIVSAPMVIVVAATGIASFTLPRYNLGLAIRITRFILLLLAGALGLYGISLGFIALTIHLVNLHSFGVPYFVPASPQKVSGMKDFILRAPRWMMTRRPAATTDGNLERIPKGQNPMAKRERNTK